jgi:hypothetical protein
MVTSLAALLVGAAHLAYLFLVYGYVLRHSSLPYWQVIIAWLVLPAIIASVGYWRISGRIPAIGRAIRVIYVLVCLFSSTYAGLFLALNAFGG